MPFARIHQRQRPAEIPVSLVFLGGLVFASAMDRPTVAAMAKILVQEPSNKIVNYKKLLD
jgi:hypothetical protein